jgi:hypothetical protein
MTFMTDNVKDETGLPVGMIAKNLGGNWSAKQIRYAPHLSTQPKFQYSSLNSEALDALMTDGHVYTTVDESHFGIAS